MNGINQNIVTRANELASLSARGENLIAACATLSAEETKALEEAVWNHSPIQSNYVLAVTDIYANRMLWQGGFWK